MLLGATLVVWLAAEQNVSASSYSVTVCADSSRTNNIFAVRSWDNSPNYPVDARCTAENRLNISPPLTTRAYQTGAGLIATHPRAAERVGDGGWGKIRKLTANFEAANANGWVSGLLNDGDASSDLTWVLGPSNQGSPVTVPGSAGGNWPGSDKPWTWGVSLFSFCSWPSCPSAGPALASLSHVTLEVSDDYAPSLDASDSVGPVELGKPVSIQLKASDAISGIRQLTAYNSKGSVLGDLLFDCDAHSWVPCSASRDTTIPLIPTYLSVGENLVRLQATDYAGNKTQKPVQVSITQPQVKDPTPPEPKLKPAVVPTSVRDKIRILRVTVKTQGKPTRHWLELSIPAKYLASKIRAKAGPKRVTAKIGCVPKRPGCKIRQPVKRRGNATILRLGDVPKATTLTLTLRQLDRTDTVWIDASPLGP